MESSPNSTFREIWPALCEAKLEFERIKIEHASSLAQVASLGSRLMLLRAQQETYSTRMEELKPQLGWCPDIPGEVQISIAGQLGALPRARFAMVCTEFRMSMQLVRSRRILNGYAPLCAAVGLNHTVVCTPSGVFSWGIHKGVLYGHEHFSIFHRRKPARMPGLADKCVVGVAAAMCHTAVCTAAGRVYTFGCSRMGALGHGFLPDREELTPRLVEGLVTKRVVAVATGRDFTVVHTSDQQVYTFGLGCKGQLGHGETMCELVPRLVERFAGVNVSCIAAGDSHTVACTTEGHLYSFGAGLHGQLGHGTRQDELEPRLVIGLLDNHVTGLAAGNGHTVVRTINGQLYTLGRARTRCHTHVTPIRECVPRLELALVGTNVTQVAAGDAHSLVCTSEGQLYTWGCGSQGQLGHGLNYDEGVPRLVQSLVGRRVVGLAIGSANHSVVWTDDGQVYSFGSGQCGTLGHGDLISIALPRALAEDEFD